MSTGSDLVRADLLASLEASGWISSTALVIDRPDLPFEKYEALGALLGKLGTAVKFWTGDFLLYGEKVYGEPAAQASEALNLSAEGRQECLRVSLAIPPAQRRPGLSWWHHRLVASKWIMPQERDELLDRAEQEQLTTRELEATVRDLRSLDADSRGATESSDEDARELVPLVASERELVKALREALDEHGETLTASEVRQVVRKRAQRREREEKLAGERAAMEAEARAQIDALQACGIEPLELHVADVREWRPEGVSTIITDPPYITDDALDLYSAVADFALDVLPDEGALVAMTWGPMLLDVVKAMDRRGLVFRSPIALLYENAENTADRTRRVFDGWKPVLVFHKDAMPSGAAYFNDVISSPAPAKEHHAWGQSPEGFERLVRAFSQPGDVVCDPFLGGGTTAVAALANARRFVGADVDSEAVNAVQARLRRKRLAV